MDSLVKSISKIRGLDLSSRKEVLSAVIDSNSSLYSSYTKFLSALFDGAVNSVSAHTGQKELNIIETYVAACLVALDHCHPKATDAILDQFLDSVLLPAISLPHFPSSFYIQVSAYVFSLMTSRKVDIGRMLNRCSSSLVSHLEGKPTASTLPLHACCCLIPGLIESDGAIATLQPIAFSLLQSSNDSLATASLKNLIAPMIDHYSPDAIGLEAMRNQLINCCIIMMKQPGIHRRNALSALVQLPPNFSPPLLIATTASEGQTIVDTPVPDIESVFWAEMIRCLASKDDALDRKRALYILQQVLGNHLLSSHPWAAWLALYGIQEEFAIHLIKPLWGVQVCKLHPASSQSDKEEFEGHGKLRIGLNGRVDKIKGKAGNSLKDKKNAPEAETHRLHMSWQCAIWSRGLSHPNLLMHRLTMRTFLNRDWGSPNLMKEVPVGFVTGYFLPSILHEELHYSPSVADDEYTGGSQLFDVQGLASSWLSAWFEVKARSEVREAIKCFLCLTITTRDIPRSCLRHSWSIFSSALQSAHSINLFPPEGPDDGFAGRMIYQLKSCLTNLSLPSGSKLKMDLALCLVQAAAVIAPLKACDQAGSDKALPGPLDLIVDLPRPWISPQGGHLNDICRWAYIIV